MASAERTEPGECTVKGVGTGKDPGAGVFSEAAFVAIRTADADATSAL